MSVVGEAQDGRQAVQITKRLQPDVVVMDIAMSSLNGMEATRQISRESPKCKVLILSSHSDDVYVQQLSAAGASGYLVKQTAAKDLVAAIRETKKGNAFFSPVINQTAVGTLPRFNRQTARGEEESQTHSPRVGSASIDRGRLRQQTNRRRTVRQHQNHRETPATAHEQVGNSQRGRTHPLCHCHGGHRNLQRYPEG